jgi:S1-C subfamily serine protease
MQTFLRGNKDPVPSTTPAGVTASQKTGTGTIFYVNADGMAITNSHVVAGCKEVKVEGSDSAKVVTQDTANDLALVKITGATKAFGRIDSDPGNIRQGEDIVVFGFPLNSVLSSGGNLTPGVISALTGLGNNTNQIQITAPIQPGSSGSPVLNAKGRVVGVVAMKLSDSKMAQATGQVAQNINFAVGG